MVCASSSTDLVFDGKPVSSSSFEYHEQLGSGSFGSVFRVTHRASGEALALKVLERSHVSKYALVEREVLAGARHPYVLSLRFAFQHEGRLALVLPLCPRGDLNMLVKRCTRLTENLARHYLAQLVLAVAHLHDHGIIHRDLKPENVLLDAEQQALLADFGISKPRMGAEPATSFVGSVAFAAPEVLWQRGHAYSVDVWGLGVTLYALVVGRPPFRGPSRDHVWHAIKWGPLEVPEYVSEPCAELLGATMKKVPQKRLGATAVRRLEGHGFFNGVDFQAMLGRSVPCPEPTPTPAPAKPSKEQAPESEEEQLTRVFGAPAWRGLCCLRRPVQRGWDFAAGEADRSDKAISTDISNLTTEYLMSFAEHEEV